MCDVQKILDGLKVVHRRKPWYEQNRQMNRRSANVNQASTFPRVSSNPGEGTSNGILSAPTPFQLQNNDRYECLTTINTVVENESLPSTSIQPIHPFVQVAVENQNNVNPENIQDVFGQQIGIKQSFAGFHEDYVSSINR